MLKTFTLALGLLAGAAVHAQGGAVSPAKKELVGKVLALQQRGIENMARTLVEQPALQLMQRAGVVLQTRIPVDQREAMGKELQGDARKYVEEALPIVRSASVRLAPSTIGTLLEEKFNEDELKQLIGILESLDSPVHRKFVQLSGDMQKSLGAKLVEETKGQVEPKLRALEQTMAKRVGAPLTPQGGAAAPASAAAPAKK